VVNAMTLPASLAVGREENVAVLELRRAEKRNALDDVTVQGIGEFVSELPAWVEVVVLSAHGDHFSAGLDLSTLQERDATQGVQHSRMWHRAYAAIEDCPVPVLAALKGAVIGGGLELAVAAHLRVADATAYFALPEGKRGLFVGGGASVRVSRLIGAQRVRDMMLTGRTISAEDASAAGLVDYVVPAGQALPTALSLAERISANSRASNEAILHALPVIAATHPSTGYFIESLVAGVTQSNVDSKNRMSAFLAGRAARVTHRTDKSTEI
jgi:enoyl-CoA hydratase/carnithine racemase